MFDPVDTSRSLPDYETDVQKYWKENKIFEQSVDRNKNKPTYVFFDGPPFANGLPHYGHILASALKDAVTRYWNMRGFYVPRTNGWDCHGLPVEYEIEKNLEISGKKQIEEFGISNFNESCRQSVFTYAKEWQVLLERIGRWVDFDNTYATLDTTYMESIWWVFKEIWKKGLIYQDYKSMHVCPRCETPLSNFEVTQGYKEVTDLSVTSKFKLLDKKHPNTFILAWTTTPWTLPGNMALCLGPDIEYSKVKVGDEYYILATALLEKNFPETEFAEKTTLSAKELAGLTYEPLFPYFTKEKKNRFTIVLDKYVTTEDGTGVVHIAGGYGAEDHQISNTNKLDIIVHTKMDGTFIDEVTEFAGKFVKGQEQNIAKYLDEKNLLFSKENYRHSYPHCWRCDTPLLNYSLKAWFIRVTDLKDRLIANNEKINWQPAHIKHGRFGKWLDGVRDWNVSRNRYWGTPLPIWECTGCDKKECLGSLNELRQKATNGNEVFFVRHGQSDHNVQGLTNTDAHDISNLVDLGKKQAAELAEKLADKGISVIYSSPFPRCEQTAKIINQKLNVDIIFDERLHEFQSAHGVPFTETAKRMSESEDPLNHRDTPTSESLNDVKKRLEDFLNYIGEKYDNKKILVVSHGAVLGQAKAIFSNTPLDETAATQLSKISHTEYISGYCGELPTNPEKDIDLHRPYIDATKITCECGSEMKRTSEVLDCWFESGAMPYAKSHYPFENKKEFENNFPAEFIAEGLDQTRGWFYTLHVLSTILFDEPAFKNVIVNGILLSKNGEKLSKRKKNYPDPSLLFQTKGVDATRLFLYQSPTPVAENVRFSDDHVDEVFKKYNLTLWNTYSFFITYARLDNFKPDREELKNFKPTHELDRWILSLLQSLTGEVNEQMENYNLTKASRPLTEFLDNLSNWYIRRSRRRFWKSDSDTDKLDAYKTCYIVLTQFCKLAAPFTPFITETIYRNLTDEESVHFADYPVVNKDLLDEKLNEKIELIRNIVGLGHTIRGREKLKVRQPLSKLELSLADPKLNKVVEKQLDVITEELNIKEVSINNDASDKIKLIIKPDAKKLGPKYGKEVQNIIKMAKSGDFTELKNNQIQVGDYTLLADEYEKAFVAQPGVSAESGQGIVVILHTQITPELKREGYARDLVRIIQDMRKQADFQVSDRIQILLKTSDPDLDQTIDEHSTFIEDETLAIQIQTKGDLEYDLELEKTIDDRPITVALKKADV